MRVPRAPPFLKKGGAAQNSFAGGAKKKFARFARGQVSHPPFQIPEYAPALIICIYLVVWYRSEYQKHLH